MPISIGQAAVSRCAGDGVFVATDVGSTVRLCYPPYSADVALALGSAVAVAGGFARTGASSIAVTGDYALLHSGLTPLLDVVSRGLPVVVVVHVNGVQGKTGGQPVPPVDWPRLLGGLGTVPIQLALTRLSADALYRSLRDLLSLGRPAVVMVTEDVAVSGAPERTAVGSAGGTAGDCAGAAGPGTASPDDAREPGHVLATRRGGARP